MGSVSCIIVKRVLILGCPASGKSTFARKLAASTGLPLVHLDRLFWRPNWVEATEAEFNSSLASELPKDAWIIDGNYGRTIAQRLQRADTAIFLDFPRWLCLYRAVKRSLTGWGRARPDMAGGCNERFHAAFLKFIWEFRKNHRPKLLTELERFPGAKIVLCSTNEVGRFFEQLR